ncbi:fluoride efflux transporter CrcB [Solibacillus sp. FSL W7-1464]|uniref:fluoride efflux transporter CrcB n=1 Tax=Solibacillus sp. FSL W7-1464 TaxID=2921706 RepID=UPI0030F59391
MINFLLVAVGGFFGAILRAVISKRLNHKNRFVHFGTFTVNVFGSFALGFLVNMHIHANVNLILSIGFLGAFTTFSTFKLESLTLVHAKQSMQFVLYSLLTYTVGLSFAFAGFGLANLYLS